MLCEYIIIAIHMQNTRRYRMTECSTCCGVNCLFYYITFNTINHLLGQNTQITRKQVLKKTPSTTMYGHTEHIEVLIECKLIAFELNVEEQK